MRRQSTKNEEEEAAERRFSFFCRFAKCVQDICSCYDLDTLFLINNALQIGQK